MAAVGMLWNMESMDMATVGMLWNMESMDKPYHRVPINLLCNYVSNDMFWNGYGSSIIEYQLKYSIICYP